MALREVEVYENTRSAASRILDLPFGRLRAGMEVNYLTFVQSTNNRRSVTNFDAIKLVYGYVEAELSS